MLCKRWRNGGIQRRVKSVDMKNMNSRSWRNPGLAILLLGAVHIPGTAQSFDTSATGTVKGAYFVRQVLTIPDANTSAILRAVSLIGTMTFDGMGGYTFTGQLMDSKAGNAQAFSTTGGYGVSANGFAQVQNPIDNFLRPSNTSADLEYGAVGGPGPTAIVASSTETQQGYNDVFIAIPAGSGVTNGSVQGTYRAGFIDFLQANADQVRDGFYALTSNGNGSFGNVTVSGSMANQGSTVANQTLNGVTYNIANANGSGTITFPTSSTPLGALVSGQKTFYVSADGNLLLGGAFNGFDLIVGTKAISGTANNGMYIGTYYTAALENGVSGACGQSNCIDSFYGSTNSNGQGTAIGHLRLTTFNISAYDYTFDQTYNFGSDGTLNDGVFEYMLGANGQVNIGVGSGQYYSLTVGIRAIQYPATTVFLNPIGIVNTANFAPVTNSVAPNEFVTLFGSGLSPATLTAQSLPLQNMLGGVQVTLNGTAVPIFYVSSSQIIIITPFSTPTYSFATFQVNNNGVKSNPITLYTATSAPGVFTTTATGVGPAAVTHANGAVVTASNPAKAGETLVVYLNGLGAVSPAVPSGAAAPLSPLSNVVDQNVFVEIMDQKGNFYSTTLAFAGLAPTYAGLYQINFTMPSGANAVPSGTAWLNINTTDAYTTEARLFVQ
jgi:uncharacterized protein (TIGR03437 family)